MARVINENEYEKVLNSEDDNYGTWLRKNDPDEFALSYGWWVYEEERKELHGRQALTKGANV